MPSKMVLSLETCASAEMVFSSIFRSRMRQLVEIFDSHDALGSARAFGGDQFIDTGTEIFQDEKIVRWWLCRR